MRTSAGPTRRRSVAGTAFGPAMTGGVPAIGPAGPQVSSSPGPLTGVTSRTAVVMHLSPLLAWPGPAPASVCPQRRKLHKPDLSQLQEYTAFRCLMVLSLGNAAGGVGCGFSPPRSCSSPRTLLESTRAHQAGRSWGPGRAGPQPITPPSASSPLPPSTSWLIGGSFLSS